MATRAMKFLRERAIAFEVLHYMHAEKGAVFAARATGFPLSGTVKTLVVDLQMHRYGLVLLPGDKKLSFKRLAKCCGVKRAAMTDVATAERLTGYRVGGISPFGTRRRLPVVMDASVFESSMVLINAGQRGIMLKMTPVDIAAALGGRVCNVAQPS